MCRLSNLSFFGIPLLYYITLNSSIIFCLSFGEIYLYLGISLLTSFDCISSLCDFFDPLGFAVILSTILLPIKSPVPSAGFRIALFEAVFIASVADFLAVSTNF